MRRKAVSGTACTACLVLLTCAGWAAEPFFVAMGYSNLGRDRTTRDILPAAREAATDLMARFQAAGKSPSFVLFIESTATSPDGARWKVIMDTVRAIVGAPTFGTGGDVYQRCWGEVPEGGVSTFGIWGFTGGNVDIDAVVIPDTLPWPGNFGVGDQAARDSCVARGRAAGRMVPAGREPRLIIQLGAMHLQYNSLFADGVRQVVGTGAPYIAGAGRMTSYIYADGRDLVSRGGTPVNHGQMIVVMSGDIAVGLGGGPLAHDPIETVRQSVDGALSALRAPPTAIIAFSCAGSNLSMAEGHAALRHSAGPEAVLVGGKAGGEAGTDNEGSWVAGSGLFVVAAIGAATTATAFTAQDKGGRTSIPRYRPWGALGACARRARACPYSPAGRRAVFPTWSPGVWFVDYSQRPSAHRPERNDGSRAR